MQDIYTFAQQTLIYLGESNDECKEAMNGAARAQLDDRLRKLVEGCILMRTWFTRVWTYQELVLSKQPWIQCGRDRLRWDVLYNAYFPIVATTAMSSTSRQEIPAVVESFRDMQIAREPSESSTLYSIMVSRRGFGVTNPRDLVYGHLAVTGLPTPENKPACPVVGSVAEIFTNATIHMCSTSSSYEPLLHVETTDTRAGYGHFPSWVPDWTLRATKAEDEGPQGLGICPITPLTNISQYTQAPQKRWVTSQQRRVLFLQQLSTRQVFYQKVEERVYFATSKICAIDCVHIGVITTTSPAIPAREDLSRRPEIADLRASLEAKAPRSEFIAYYRRAYQYLREVLGEGVIKPLPSKDKILADGIDFKYFWPHFEPAHDYNKDLEPFRYFGVEGYLVRHALLRENGSPGGEVKPGFALMGRKIARLSHNGSAIVPSTTEPGDEIYACVIKNKLRFLVVKPFVEMAADHPDGPYGLGPASNFSTFVPKEEYKGEYGLPAKHGTLLGFVWMEGDLTRVKSFAPVKLDRFLLFDGALQKEFKLCGTKVYLH